MIKRLIISITIFTSLNTVFATENYKAAQLCEDCESNNVQFVEFCCTDIAMVILNQLYDQLII